MAKKVFTTESLKTLIDESKAYTDASVSTKANISHTHTLSDITDITASATELNYTSGVTSNIQEQLDNRTLVTIKRW